MRPISPLSTYVRYIMHNPLKQPRDLKQYPEDLVKIQPSGNNSVLAAFAAMEVPFIKDFVFLSECTK